MKDFSSLLKSGWWRIIGFSLHWGGCEGKVEGKIGTP